MKIEDLNLSLRAYNALKRAGVDTVEQLRKRTPTDLLRIRGIGKTLLWEILDKVCSDNIDS